MRTRLPAAALVLFALTGIALVVPACPPADGDATPSPSDTAENPTAPLGNPPVINSLSFSDDDGSPIYYQQDSQTGITTRCDPATDQGCYRGLEITASTHDDDGNIGRSEFLLRCLDETTGGERASWNFRAEAQDATDINWTFMIVIGSPNSPISPDTQYVWELTMWDNRDNASDPYSDVYMTPTW